MLPSEVPVKEQHFVSRRAYTKRDTTTAIAVHWTAGSGGRASALYHWYETAPHEVNCHYAIDCGDDAGNGAGDVYQYVPEDEVSWCTNSRNPDTISIEVCNKDKDNLSCEWSEATYKSFVTVTAILCNKYHLNPLRGGVIRHYDVTKKNCPLKFVPRSANGIDDENCSNYKKFLADVVAEMSGESTSSIVDDDKYLYHPLGDYAKGYYDGAIAITDQRYPHTYHGHGLNRIDINVGIGQPLYAMASGIAECVSGKVKTGETGYVVALRTTSTYYSKRKAAATGKTPEQCPVYFMYLEMGYLASPFAEIIGVKPGTDGTYIYDSGIGSTSNTVGCNIEVKKGQLIGYTNGVAGQSSVHIDIQGSNRYYGGGSGDGNIRMCSNDYFGSPAATSDTLNPAFTVSNGILYKNGEVVGVNGKVPDLNGSPTYDVYDYYFNCLIIPKVEKL